MSYFRIRTRTLGTLYTGIERLETSVEREETRDRVYRRKCEGSYTVQVSVESGNEYDRSDEW